MKDAKPPFRSRKQEPGTARARPSPPEYPGCRGMGECAKSSPARFSQAILAFWEPAMSVLPLLLVWGGVALVLLGLF